MGDTVPQGYVRVDRDGAELVLRVGLEDALLAAGIAFPDELVRRSPASGLVGRGALAIFEIPGGRAVLRLHRRGGLLGKVVKRLSLDRERARDELAVSAGAIARGASVAEPLAAVTRPRGLGWEHALATRAIEDARDLERILLEARGVARRRAIATAGEAVRRLHDAGVEHADLNVKNILVSGEAGIVIDLDRATLHASLERATRDPSLVRLLRSFYKLAQKHAGLSKRDPFRFARAYSRGDRALRRELRALGEAALPGLRRRASIWRALGTVPRSPA
jgi:3-deoxy-D-manno-octulosonic acid kinase